MSIPVASPARHAAVSLPALLALVMPKCPLCAMALFSALGIELRAVAPLTIALIVTPALLIASRRASALALVIAFAGAAAALAGRFAFDRPLLFHAGVAALVAAAVINAVALRRQCDHCAAS